MADGLFSMIDIDGDGFLTHAEFKTALQSRMKDLTDSDITTLIGCGEDQDGQIDKEKFSNLLRTIQTYGCGVLLLLLCV